ncbi:MAG: signal peptidase I [Bdellovibrionales bacterium]|nr:signal peptidase I [Bdellovibrionales bacterium]NQZ19655.1 signal peptidase I [Bdellovibrionales bacterium]
MKSYPVQVIFREYFEGIIAALFLAAFLRIFVVNVLYIPTDNMSPGLEKGDFVIGWKLSYGFPLPLSAGERLNQKLPQRGDIVAFRFPGDEEQTIIRRIMGLPGETVSISGGKVSINGQELKYSASEDVVIEQVGEGSFHNLKDALKGDLKEVQIPEGQYFVLSDHRSQYDDSRAWGMVPLKNIESQIGWIWLSLDGAEEGLGIQWPRMFQWVN